MRLPDVSDGPIFSVLPEKMGEKRGAGMRLVLSASEFRRGPGFQASFHSEVTLRVSAARRLIQGAKFAAGCLRTFAVNRRCRPDLLVCTFLRGGFIDLHAPRLPLLRGAGAERLRGEPRRSGPMAPLLGELSPKVTERSSQICCDLSVSAPPSHLPWKGRLWDCALQGFPYEGKAGAAEN